MRLAYIIGLTAVAFSFALTATKGDEAAPQALPTESCLNCKFKRCLESLATQRQALIAGYSAIAGSPAIAVRDDSGKALDQINTDTMPHAGAYLLEIATKGRVYEQAVDRMASRIPNAECGPPATETIAAETNLLSCERYPDKLHAAMAAMPCKQLADMINNHERAHFDACVARKHRQGQAAPYIYLTPAGVAKEEVGAYRTELATIQKMLDQLKQPRLVGEAVSEERFPAPMGTIRETVTGTYNLNISEGTPQRVTGEGESTVVWDLSKSQCSVNSEKGTGKVTVSGQVSDGILTLSVVSMEHQNATVRVTCPQGFGFSLPTPFKPSKITIAYKDGETVVQTPVNMPQATVKNTYTLHLKCKEPESGT